MRFRSMVGAAAPVLALSLLLGACGDDDDGDAAATTTAEAGGDRELCDLVQETSEQDGFPTPAQIAEYTELAPPEIQDAVAVAGPVISAADGDPVKFFAGIAPDDVEAAVAEINAFETAECGVEHDPAPSAEVSTIDPAATRVDVTSAEYTFDFDTDVPAGKVSFVLTNPGAEAHFMTFTQINEGHTLDEALSYEGDPDDAGITSNVEGDSGLAAPGGEDEEVATLDLQPGSYAMLCFVAAPDGQPHAFKGMAVPFTVS